MDDNALSVTIPLVRVSQKYTISGKMVTTCVMQSATVVEVNQNGHKLLLKIIFDL